MAVLESLLAWQRQYRGDPFVHTPTLSSGPPEEVTDEKRSDDSNETQAHDEVNNKK